MAKPTRQEVAYQEIGATFLALIQRDPLIDTETRKTVVAWWVDLFDHPGVANNMKLAISNLLAQQDKRVDAARKAGMVQVLEAFDLAVPADAKHPANLAVSKLVHSIVSEQLEQENSPVEMIGPEDMDLSELGEEDEDNTPIPL